MVNLRRIMLTVAVTFMDTDGDKVEYRVNSTSGKLDCFVNGRLDCAGLTTCTRNGATIIDDAGQTTAPDEDTARRVIELFQYCSTKARFSALGISIGTERP